MDFCYFSYLGLEEQPRKHLNLECFVGGGEHGYLRMFIYYCVPACVPAGVRVHAEGNCGVRSLLPLLQVLGSRLRFSDLCIRMLLLSGAIFCRYYLGFEFQLQSNQQSVSLYNYAVQRAYIVSKPSLPARTFYPSTLEDRSRGESPLAWEF